VQRGDRVVLCMQNCPQLVMAHFAILRADAVVVPVNPMNRAEELKHYITDPDTKVAITTADLAAAAGQGQLTRCHPPQRPAHLIVTQFTDAFDANMRATTPRPSLARLAAARATRCLRCRRPGACLGRRAGRRRPLPAPYRPARRPGRDALHQRHHRPAQGLHAHAPSVMHNAVASAVGQRHGRRTWRWWWCRCSTSPAW
jgi:fatty-acyl-CoA synthase